MTIIDKVLKMTSMPFPRGRTSVDAKIQALQRVSAALSPRRSEKGVVLLIVLVLAAVSLTLITAMLYMITVGTQASGIQKRYRTALEACVAGSDIVKQAIEVRGDPAPFLNGLTGLNAVQNASLNICSGDAFTSGAQVHLTGPAAKIMTSTATWKNCGSTSLTMGPSDYDYTFQLGTNPSFNVYAKIVDVREGNTVSSSNPGGRRDVLVKSPVVSFGGGEIASQNIPYLYTFEVDCENRANSTERAKLSVLYQY